MITRRGIFHDLRESFYYKLINYPSGNVIYFFSSKNYLNKFEEERVGFQYELREKFRKKYGFCFSNFELLADLVFYKSIEIRGFRVVKDGREFQCPENLILNGEIVIE